MSLGIPMRSSTTLKSRPTAPDRLRSRHRDTPAPRANQRDSEFYRKRGRICNVYQRDLCDETISDRLCVLHLVVADWKMNSTKGWIRVRRANPSFFQNVRRKGGWPDAHARFAPSSRTG